MEIQVKANSTVCVTADGNELGEAARRILTELGDQEITLAELSKEAAEILFADPAFCTAFEKSFELIREEDAT